MTRYDALRLIILLLAAGALAAGWRWGARKTPERSRPHDRR